MPSWNPHQQIASICRQQWWQNKLWLLERGFR